MLVISLLYLMFCFAKYPHRRSPWLLCLTQNAVLVVDPKRQNRWMFAAVMCFVTVFLIGGAGLLGFIFGQHMKTNRYEESWATYRNTITGTIIKQRYIVDGNELLIVKPGELSLIYDYEKSQSVVQVVGMKYTATNDCLCLVYDFDTTERVGLDKLVELMKSKEIEETGSSKVTNLVLETTGNKMTVSNLSKRSQELCHGCAILEAVARESTGDNKATRRKRSSNCRTSAICETMLFEEMDQTCQPVLLDLTGIPSNCDY